MAFDSENLEAIYTEVHRRQVEAVRLSLVEFDDAEYAALLRWGRRIAREYEGWGWPQRSHARLVFLAFVMAFVRRTKYADDSIFWPDLEEALGLSVLERRVSMDDLLWFAYEQAGLGLSYDDRGRRIVGTLLDELRDADRWAKETPAQFVMFFKWYYRHYPEHEISTQLITAYRQQTRALLTISEKTLPVLSRDCQLLTQVIDYAIENGLYLRDSRLDEYRSQVVSALGAEADPVRLRLIRDQRMLVRLIMELQNHLTPGQFERELTGRGGGELVAAPWGEQLNLRRAVEGWKPFSYGVYRIDECEYRVVPHPRLRLEMLDDWPLGQVVQWQGTTWLGYKKRRPFEVLVSRRTLEATPYWRSPKEQLYVWVGQVPVGEKLSIDGRPCLQSRGADWHTGLKLDRRSGEHPALCVAVERLVLYYPDLPHSSVSLRASTGYAYSDSLREDGVRRFHRHGKLVVPLSTFDASVQVNVLVADETVLTRTFEPEACYLFSKTHGEQAHARGLADAGDREYVLFVAGQLLPQAGPGVSVVPLPESYGTYVVYQITWESNEQPFELQVGPVQWSFQRRREFVPFVVSRPLLPHLRLKPHQLHQFTDLVLRLYSNLDLTAPPLALQVWDEDGLVSEISIGTHVQKTDILNLYEIRQALWPEIDRLVAEHWGRYTLAFLQGDAVLGELDLALVPPVDLEWNSGTVYPEGEALNIAATTPQPAWDQGTRQAATRVHLSMHPKVQGEWWSERPGLRHLIPQPVSTPLVFPGIAESVEVIVTPRLFGVRLYLVREDQTSYGQRRTTYQPVEQADYYHLDRTTFYAFSAPGERIEIACGALCAFAGQTDTNGELLIDSLSFLQKACLEERTEFSVRTRDLRASFTVQWSPLLHEMRIEDKALAIRFNGPEDTGLRLSLHDAQGLVSDTWEIACQGGEATQVLPLPPHCPAPGWVTAEYLLQDGQTRSAAQQIQIRGDSPKFSLLAWLEEGIGIAQEQDWLSLAGSR